MIECVQGEGGVNIIDAEWAKAAAAAARKVGALVMADEVQTGVGRTGAFLASDPPNINHSFSRKKTAVYLNYRLFYLIDC